MRPCPSCNYEHREYIDKYQEGYNLYQCRACGMRYLDGDNASQARLDAYYGMGDTSPDLQEQDSVDRLKALAERTKGATRILDIGGKYSPLRGMIKCDTLGPGETMRGPYDLFIISHTLEHVYDVNILMDEIVKNAEPEARIIVEVPFWTDYAMTGYDEHWQHVNKFRAGDVERLLHRFGFVVRVAIRLPDFRGFKCWRVEGELTC